MSYSERETFNRDRFRANLLKYTRKAFYMLPRLNKPRILDIGCGSGVATLELARISDGNIIAVDINGKALDRLVERAAEEGLSDRITVMHTSMMEMNFPSAGFDIIWTEGAISYIGFARGLSEWRALLVPNGYLIVHDALSDSQKKIELTRACGYSTVGRFELPQDIWWNEYCAPMKKRLEELYEMNPDDKRVIEEMKLAEKEINGFDFESDWFASFFLVLMKI
ncbi:MAG: class I SAM-dependent methyltransferase [Candidatus Zixiibacteriota bacterium]